MSYDFNADEIFEIAEQIERNGAKFYRTAAESVADEDKKTAAPTSSSSLPHRPNGVLDIIH